MDSEKEAPVSPLLPASPGDRSAGRISARFLQTDPTQGLLDRETIVSREGGFVHRQH
jgi:hypothetical protein